MQPKTKFQRMMCEVQKSLPKSLPKHAKWALQNVLKNYGAISRNRAFCLECGHKWKPEQSLLDNAEQPQKKGPDLTTKCTKCKKQLCILRYNQTTTDTASHWGLWSVHEGYQVIRIFTIVKVMVKQKPMHWYSSEDIQYWIGQDGRITTFSRIAPFGYAGNYFTGNMELRENGIEENQRYNIDLYDNCIYPERKMLPEIARNGFTGEYYGLSPQQMFAFLMNGTVGETLLKTNRLELFQYFAKNRRVMDDKLWTAMKIAFRNNYKLNPDRMKGNLSDWIDYIKLLIYFKKDIHNAHYVCPKDLHVEHNRYVQRKTRIDDMKMKNRDEKAMLKERLPYEQMKKRFFHIVMKGRNGLVIEPMKTVDQVRNESKFLSHCAFASGYHKKDFSLLLSAQIDGVIMETVEVNLRTFKVQQARGRFNKATDYHKRIVSLVDKEMFKIQEAMKPKRKSATSKPTKTTTTPHKAA